MFTESAPTRGWVAQPAMAKDLCFRDNVMILSLCYCILSFTLLCCKFGIFNIQVLFGVKIFCLKSWWCKKNMTFCKFVDISTNFRTIQKFWIFPLYDLLFLVYYFFHCCSSALSGTIDGACINFQLIVAVSLVKAFFLSMNTDLSLKPSPVKALFS